MVALNSFETIFNLLFMIKLLNSKSYGLNIFIKVYIAVELDSKHLSSDMLPRFFTHEGGGWISADQNKKPACPAI